MEKQKTAVQKFFLSLRSQLTLGFVLSRIGGYMVFLMLLPSLTVKNHRDHVENHRFEAFTQQVLLYHQTHQTLQNLTFTEGTVLWNAREQQPLVSAESRELARTAGELAVLDPEGRLLTPLGSLQVGSRVKPEQIKRSEVLQQGGKVLGTAVLLKPAPLAGYTPDEKALLSSVNRTVLVTLPTGVAFAIVMGILIAYVLTLPLIRLTRAAQAVMRKEKITAVPVTQQNEVGDLTRAFNGMLKSLEDGEKQRRQMIADIAHDLGTPLTVASGYVQGMHQGKLQATPERLQVVHEELLLLQNLVEDLRTLSLADEGKLKLNLDQVPVERLVGGVHQAFKLKAEKANIDLELQVQGALPTLALDFDRMRQVLGNLVNNSLHHTQSGGRIVLLAQQTPAGLVLEVEDTGKGISSEKLPHIFDRFFRADESRRSGEGEGSGLGLAIARSIVELHGGKISARSVLGEGTTVQVVLPV